MVRNPSIEEITMRVPFLALLAGLRVLPLPLMADTTYTYTGNPFTSFQHGGIRPFYTADDFISGFFTLASPLAPDTYYANITPDSLTFTDGINVIGGGDTYFPYELTVSTDASGDIDQWLISLGSFFG